MDDKVFAGALADKLAAEHAHLQAATGFESLGTLRDWLSKIFLALRSANVPWSKIIALAGQILMIVTTGNGDWQAIIAEIWTLFFPPVPPVPTIG